MHEIPYSAIDLKDGMSLFIYSDKPHICRVLSSEITDPEVKAIKLEFVSPFTPCFTSINLLVLLKNTESSSLTPLEVMQVRASFE